MKRKYYIVEFYEDNLFSRRILLLAHSRDDAFDYAKKWATAQRKALPSFYYDLHIQHILPITAEHYYIAMDNGIETHCTDIHLLID